MILFDLIGDWRLEIGLMVTNNHETSINLACSLSLFLLFVCILQEPDTSDDTLSNLTHTETPRYNSTTTNEMEARDKKTIDWMMVMNGIDDWIGLD